MTTQPANTTTANGTATGTTATTVAGLRALLDTIDVTSTRPREIRNLRALFNALTVHLDDRRRAQLWADIRRTHHILGCLMNPKCGCRCGWTTSTVLVDAGAEPTGSTYADDETAIQIAEGWLHDAIQATAHANTMTALYGTTTTLYPVP